MKKVSGIEVHHFLLKDDGIFPNNNSLPALLYKNVLHLDKRKRKAASEMEKAFEANNWKNSWRNGIYDYHHYHSITHEVLGIYSGNARVQLGGENGNIVLLEKGDVLIIPAGVAHKNLQSGKDFKCVGAYPHGIDYDINYGKPEERPQADENIRHVKLPDHDPVFGDDRPLFDYWK